MGTDGGAISYLTLSQKNRSAMKKRLIRLALIFLGLLVTLVLLAAVVFRLINRINGTLVSSGEKRSYLLYVPETYNPATPTPLVISLHGYAEWPAHQMQISHWNDLAEQYGFIVVYPSGTQFPLRWHTRGEPGSDTDPMLDVTFISDLIDQLESEYNLDPARIYVNGLSNGGGMSFVLSCKLSERIAAIGTVSGAYLFPWSECHPSRPVPTIVFHGTADPIVPYQGGPSKAFDLPFPSIPEWIDALARHNGCTGAPLELPASGDVSGVQFANCASNAEVIFYTIAGGGHSWPGGEPMPESIVGYTTQDINATKTMWDFFQQHPLTGE
jgi:polyhydroxybutyrate depolymerase